MTNTSTPLGPERSDQPWPFPFGLLRPWRSGGTGRASQRRVEPSVNTTAGRVLVPGEVWRLRGARIRQVHADRGRLWVTCDGEPDDWFVGAGCPALLPPTDGVLIENDSQVSVQVTILR